MAEKPESNAKAGPGIFAKAQKRIARTKTKVLQNLGRAEKTTDDTFNDNVQRIEKQQEVAHQLQKELKNYVHCLKDLNQASQSLHTALLATYESDWTDESMYKQQLQSMELLWNDYVQNLQDSAMVPLHTYLQSFPVLKNKISKRGRKMVDYDNARHHLESLQAAKKKDEVKITKAQEDLQEAKKIYESLNNELHVELPDFYNSRVSFYAGLFSSMFGAEYTFHNETAKTNGTLGDIASQLTKDYASFVYQPKRPLSKSLSTNSSDNGLNGDASGPSAPSTPGVVSPSSTLNSPISSTSAASLNDSSQPAYSNDGAADPGTLRIHPRRKAPIAPIHLQRIDEEDKNSPVVAPTNHTSTSSSLAGSRNHGTQDKVKQKLTHPIRENDLQFEQGGWEVDLDQAFDSVHDKTSGSQWSTSEGTCGSYLVGQCLSTPWPGASSVKLAQVAKNSKTLSSHKQSYESENSTSKELAEVHLEFDEICVQRSGLNDDKSCGVYSVSSSTPFIELNKDGTGKVDSEGGGPCHSRPEECCNQDHCRIKPRRQAPVAPVKSGSVSGGVSPCKSTGSCDSRDRSLGGSHVASRENVMHCTEDDVKKVSRSKDSLKNVLLAEETPGIDIVDDGKQIGQDLFVKDKDFSKEDLGRDKLCMNTVCENDIQIKHKNSEDEVCSGAGSSSQVKGLVKCSQGFESEFNNLDAAEPSNNGFKDSYSDADSDCHDIESRPLLCDDDLDKEIEDEMESFISERLHSKSSDPAVCEDREEEEDQLVKTKMSSPRSNSKYYHMTFLDGVSSSEDEHEEEEGGKKWQEEEEESKRRQNIARPLEPACHYIGHGAEDMLGDRWDDDDDDDRHLQGEGHVPCDHTEHCLRVKACDSNHADKESFINQRRGSLKKNGNPEPEHSRGKGKGKGIFSLGRKFSFLSIGKKQSLERNLSAEESSGEAKDDNTGQCGKEENNTQAMQDHASSAEKMKSMEKPKSASVYSTLLKPKSDEKESYDISVDLKPYQTYREETEEDNCVQECAIVSGNVPLSGALPKAWMDDNLTSDYHTVTVLTESVSRIPEADDSTVSLSAKPSSSIEDKKIVNEAQLYNGVLSGVKEDKTSAVCTSVPNKDKVLGELTKEIDNEEENCEQTIGVEVVGDKVVGNYKQSNELDVAEKSNMPVHCYTIEDNFKKKQNCILGQNDIEEAKIDADIVNKDLSETEKKQFGELQNAVQNVPVSTEMQITDNSSQPEHICKADDKQRVLGVTDPNIKQDIKNQVCFEIEEEEREESDTKANKASDAYIEALASGAWNLSSFVRTLMPKTVQQLASHTKSYIDSCLHSDTPQEEDLEKIREICKDILVPETAAAGGVSSSLLVARKDRGSSVDVSSLLDTPTTTAACSSSHDSDLALLDCIKQKRAGGGVRQHRTGDSSTMVSLMSIGDGKCSTEDLVRDGDLVNPSSTCVDGDPKLAVYTVEGEMLVGKKQRVGGSIPADATISIKEDDSRSEAAGVSLSSFRDEGKDTGYEVHWTPVEIANCQDSTHLPIQALPINISQPPPPPPPPPLPVSFSQAKHQPISSSNLPNRTFSQQQQQSLSQPLHETQKLSQPVSLLPPPPPPPPPPPLPLPPTFSKPFTNVSLKDSTSTTQSCSHKPPKSKESIRDRDAAAVEILETHFQSVLMDIVAKGRSNLKKRSHRPSAVVDDGKSATQDTNTDASSSFTLHDAMMNRLQTSIPVLSKVNQVSRTGSRMSVGSHKQASWASSKESLDIGIVAPADPAILEGTETSSNDGKLEKINGRAGGSTHQSEKQTKVSSTSGLGKQLEESLASRRAAFSVRGSDENLGETSSMEDSDLCTHASGDSLSDSMSRSDRCIYLRPVSRSQDCHEKGSSSVHCFQLLKARSDEIVCDTEDFILGGKSEMVNGRSGRNIGDIEDIVGTGCGRHDRMIDTTSLSSKCQSCDKRNTTACRQSRDKVKKNNTPNSNNGMTSRNNRSLGFAPISIVTNSNGQSYRPEHSAKSDGAGGTTLCFMSLEKQDLDNSSSLGCETVKSDLIVGINTPSRCDSTAAFDGIFSVDSQHYQNKEEKGLDEDSSINDSLNHLLSQYVSQSKQLVQQVFSTSANKYNTTDCNSISSLTQQRPCEDKLQTVDSIETDSSALSNTNDDPRFYNITFQESVRNSYRPNSVSKNTDTISYEDSSFSVMKPRVNIVSTDMNISEPMINLQAEDLEEADIDVFDGWMSSDKCLEPRESNLQVFAGYGLRQKGSFEVDHKEILPVDVCLWKHSSRTDRVEENNTDGHYQHTKSIKYCTIKQGAEADVLMQRSTGKENRISKSNTCKLEKKRNIFGFIKGARKLSFSSTLTVDVKGFSSEQWKDVETADDVSTEFMCSYDTKSSLPRRSNYSTGCNVLTRASNSHQLQATFAKTASFHAELNVDKVENKFCEQDVSTDNMSKECVGGVSFPLVKVHVDSAEMLLKQEDSSNPDKSNVYLLKDLSSFTPNKHSSNMTLSTHSKDLDLNELPMQVGRDVNLFEGQSIASAISEVYDPVSICSYKEQCISINIIHITNDVKLNPNYTPTNHIYLNTTLKTKTKDNILAAVPERTSMFGYFKLAIPRFVNKVGKYGSNQVLTPKDQRLNRSSELFSEYQPLADCYCRLDNSRLMMGNSGNEIILQETIVKSPPIIKVSMMKSVTDRSQKSVSDTKLVMYDSTALDKLSTTDPAIDKLKENAAIIDNKIAMDNCCAVNKLPTTDPIIDEPPESLGVSCTYISDAGLSAVVTTADTPPPHTTERTCNSNTKIIPTYSPDFPESGHISTDDKSFRYASLDNVVFPMSNDMSEIGKVEEKHTSSSKISSIENRNMSLVDTVLNHLIRNNIAKSFSNTMTKTEYNQQNDVSSTKIIYTDINTDCDVSCISEHNNKTVNKIEYFQPNDASFVSRATSRRAVEVAKILDNLIKENVVANLSVMIENKITSAGPEPECTGTDCNGIYSHEIDIHGLNLNNRDGANIITSMNGRDREGELSEIVRSGESLRAVEHPSSQREGDMFSPQDRIKSCYDEQDSTHNTTRKGSISAASDTQQSLRDSRQDSFVSCCEGELSSQNDDSSFIATAQDSFLTASDITQSYTDSQQNYESCSKDRDVACLNYDDESMNESFHTCVDVEVVCSTDGDNTK